MSGAGGGIGVERTWEPRLENKWEFSRETGSGNPFQVHGAACVMTWVMSLLSAAPQSMRRELAGGEADAEFRR